MRFHRAAVLVLTVIGTTLLFGAGPFRSPGSRLGDPKWRALPTEVMDVVSRSTDLGPSDPDMLLNIAVSLPYRDPAGVQAYVDAVSDPNDPNYRSFLTPEEVGDRFGLTAKDVQGVVGYLEASGLKIDLVGDNHLTILARGTVSVVEGAFRTTIHEYQTIDPSEPGNTRYYSF